MSKRRGIRNNNPLNIEKGSNWRGLVASQTDDRFCVFQEPEYGIRAAAIILQSYQEKHGIRTIKDIVNRWAPPGDGNDTSAYIQAVEIWSDIDRNESLDLFDYETVYRLVRAMARMENGRPTKEDGAWTDESWYSPATWEKGLRMAGLNPGKPLTKSRTAAGTATAGAGISAAIGILTDQLGIPAEVAALLPTALSSFSEQQVAIAVLVIGLAGAGLAFWSRRDDKLKGRL